MKMSLVNLYALLIIRPSNNWAQILVLVKFIILEDLSLIGIKTTLSAHVIEWVHDWQLLVAVTDD